MRYIWLPAKSSEYEPMALDRCRALVHAELVSPVAAWWDDMRAMSGGWRGLPAAVVPLFDAAILHLTPARALARGQYSIARAFFDRGKRVGVWTGDRVTTVLRLELTSETAEGADWKMDYARPIYNLEE